MIPTDLESVRLGITNNIRNISIIIRNIKYSSCISIRTHNFLLLMRCTYVHLHFIGSRCISRSIQVCKVCNIDLTCRRL